MQLLGDPRGSRLLAEERKIDFCNGGLMAIDGRLALALLDAVGNDNAKGEYYLTDIVEIARGKGLNVVATEAPFESVLGINNRAELAEAEAIWQSAQAARDDARRRDADPARNRCFCLRYGGRARHVDRTRTCSSRRA